MPHGSTSVTLPHTEQKCTAACMLQDGFGQLAHRLGRLAQQVEGESLGGLGADAGQPGEGLDRASDRLDRLHDAGYGIPGSFMPPVSGPSLSAADVLRLAQCLVDRGDDQVLERLDVLRIDRLGADLDRLHLDLGRAHTDFRTS